MVLLSHVKASNSLIPTTFPPRLVAVFVGGTSGIGEITLKKFAKHCRQPRAYFVGRSRRAAERIVGQCKALNPHGEYIFVRADVSLIRTVDKVCEEIKEKERVVDILFLSQGVMKLDRSETSEHVHLLAALNYYSRMRFITNLLPLLHNSITLRRVVNVGGGGKEGYLDTTDFSALRVPLAQLRGHLSTLITLGLESIAKSSLDVTFIHSYPGSVNTGLYRDMEMPPFDLSTAVPIEECGERHLYLATSAKFSPIEGTRLAVQLADGIQPGTGTAGKLGRGVYSVGEDGEGTSSDAVGLLASLREHGTAEKVWWHTEAEFRRITALQ